MSNGVVYYNSGTKLFVRLLVSIHSLRKHYYGPVTILSEGVNSHPVCDQIAGMFGCEVIRVTYPDLDHKNQVYVNATKTVDHTPYNVTTWIDSDTLIVGEFDELFDAAEKYEFAIAQFANWGTKKGQINKRIKAWKGILPDKMIKAAVDYGHAINCGVFAFHKDSKLCKDWWKYAIKGIDTMIPDEVCCQIMLGSYPHKLMPKEFNVSCKYGDPYAKDARIIHYHGRKHCRFTEWKEGKDKKTDEGKGNGGCVRCGNYVKAVPTAGCMVGNFNPKKIYDGSETACNNFAPVLQYSGKLWFTAFDEVRESISGEWIFEDRQLRSNLQIWDIYKTL